MARYRRFLVAAEEEPDIEYESGYLTGFATQADA